MRGRDHVDRGILGPLPPQVEGLAAATFAESGLFLAVFLAITQERVPSLLVLVEMAVFLVGLGRCGFQLIILYGPAPRPPAEVRARYRTAWQSFVVANASVVIAALVWWMWMLYRIYQIRQGA